MSVVRRMGLLPASVVLLSTALLVGCAGESSPAETSDAAAATTADAHDADAEAHEADLFDGEPAATQEVVLSDISYSPTEITVAAGEVIELTLPNQGALEHDFTIETIDADVAMGEGGEMGGEHAMHGGDYAVHAAVAPGSTSVLRLRVHEPGEYRYFCTVEGHRAAGMEGVIRVG